VSIEEFMLVLLLLLLLLIAVKMTLSLSEWGLRRSVWSVYTVSIFLEDCKRVRSEKGKHVLRLLHNLVLNSTMRKNVVPDYNHGPPRLTPSSGGTRSRPEVVLVIPLVSNEAATRTRSRVFA
jgi:hypothetical protein